MLPDAFPVDHYGHKGSIVRAHVRLLTISVISRNWREEHAATAGITIPACARCRALAQ